MKAILHRNIVILVYVLLLPLMGFAQTYEVTTLAGGTFHDGPALEAKFSLPLGTAIDHLGNVYIADQRNHRIRKINTDGVVSTLAGSGSNSYADGLGTAASFNYPTALAVDSSGNVYVADERNHRIRKISPAGIVTTLAGSGVPAYADGLGTTASFNQPFGIAIDNLGNVYVSDLNNQRIRKINSTGVVSTLAGSGNRAFVNGIGTAASFNQPSGIAIDGGGNLYVADRGNQLIRKITPAGVVSLFAGSGIRGFNNGSISTARFNNPTGLAVDSAGNVFVADYLNHSIRQVSSTGIVTTIAGSGTNGYVNAAGTAAFFNEPVNVSIDRFGNLLIADAANNRIRKINPTGIVTTLAGSGTTTFADGIGTAASFDSPSGLVIDSLNNIYVADYNNNRIRKISSNRIVSTIAGSGDYNLTDGPGITASFRKPHSVAIDRLGNLFVTDNYNHCIRKINPSGIVSTLAGSGFQGFANGTGTDAVFYEPCGIAVDLIGNVYVADHWNQRIRIINQAGVVSTYSAGFSFPNGVAIDLLGNVYVSEMYNQRIRKVNTSRILTNFAGSGARGFADGIGSSAIFDNPSGLAVDVAGNIYLADQWNNRIRKISPDGLVTTIAGSGIQGNLDGDGANARFDNPVGIAVDAIGNIYVADAVNNSIRKITPSCYNPTTPTITGDTAFCQGSFSRLTSSSPTGNLWSTGDTTQFINVAQPGSYYVRVISGVCTSAVSVPFRVVNTRLSPTVINFDTTTSRCLGARLQLTPAGTFSYYQWNTGERTRTIYTRLSGQYTVQVANSDSCFGLPSPPIFIAFDTNWCTVEIFRFGVDSITANVFADSYIWYLDGIELLSSNTQRTIPIQGDGVYTFRAVSNGRTSPLSNPIIVTSSKKSLATTKFELFPNPATNKVTIRTNGSGTLEIVNVVGQVVMTQSATETNEINVSKLPKGVYSVRFNGASQKLVVK